MTVIGKYARNELPIGGSFIVSYESEWHKNEWDFWNKFGNLASVKNRNF